MAQITKHMLQQMKAEHEQVKALQISEKDKDWDKWAIEVEDTLEKVTSMLVAVGTSLSK